MTEIGNFRQRLDAVLRTLDVKQVSDFLIAEKQWSPGKTAEPEFAMWMATSQHELVHVGCLTERGAITG